MKIAKICSTNHYRSLDAATSIRFTMFSCKRQYNYACGRGTELTLSTQGVVLRLHPQNIAHATFMQPLQCDLQPQLQETHRTTHTGTTTCCKTHRRNQSRPERPQPQPPHRRGTFHRRLQPLYTEKHKVSCSRLPPQCNIHVAITMRLATTASRNA